MIRLKMFAFMLVAMIHGVMACAIMPARIASGGEPYRMLAQYSGCWRKQYKETNTKAMKPTVNTDKDEKVNLCFRHLISGIGL